ncbi:MAG: hypothetical protein LBJ74_00450 [Heliobacteriaceae bacterium]|jgi:hypothetical protein|nr:hypothetical protein [Heliobacteriaceae bacterium]
MRINPVTSNYNKCGKPCPAFDGKIINYYDDKNKHTVGVELSDEHTAMIHKLNESNADNLRRIKELGTILNQAMRDYREYEHPLGVLHKITQTEIDNIA